VKRLNLARLLIPLPGYAENPGCRLDYGQHQAKTTIIDIYIIYDYLVIINQIDDGTVEFSGLCRFAAAWENCPGKTYRALLRRPTPGERKPHCFDDRYSWDSRGPNMIDAEALLRHAMALAQSIASKSPLAVAGCKTAINFARDHSTPESLRHMALLQSAIFDNQDLVEAISAWHRKRQGRFDPLSPLTPSADR